MTTLANLNTTQWNKKLIEKYNIRKSCYNSYPTTTQFNNTFTEEDYKKALTYMKEKTFEPLSLYIHIPFCQTICYYCACNKVITQNEQDSDIYLNYLEKEMSLVHDHISHHRRVTQLHVGGGSPTFLNTGQLTRLIHTLSRYFYLTDLNSREYSIEIDPRFIDTSHLALLKGLGFNHLNLSLQDFSPKVQQAINRFNSFEAVQELVVAARDYQYSSINFDLIYGLPKQTLNSLTETIQQIISLNPNRIAFHDYIHLPEIFSSQRAIDQVTLPSIKQKFDMLNLINTLLTAAGYRYLGIDHFVKPDDKLALAQENGSLLRNFQGYTLPRATDLIGLGMSSISSGATFFSQNKLTLAEYYQSLESGQLPVNKGIQCSNDDIKRRVVIMGLINNLTVNITEWEKCFSESFFDYFAVEAQKLKAMQENGLLIIDAENIQVLPVGRALICDICTIFDLYHNSSS